MTPVNIYRSGGLWFMAVVDPLGACCSYEIDVDGTASEAEARAEVLGDFPDADVRRVADVDFDGREEV